MGNCTEYKLEEFKERGLRAEKKIFGKQICSPQISRLSEIKPTLYPSWLIRDDVFQVMKYHFATSEWVDQLKQRNDTEKGVDVICCVIPENVVSLYDDDTV